MVDAPIFRRYQTSQCFRLSSENIGSSKGFLFRDDITNTMTLKGTGRENIEDFVHDPGQNALWKEEMSEILRRLRGRTGHFARSDKGPVTSSNGAEALPHQLLRRSGRAPPRKSGAGKRLIQISAGIICVGIVARIGHHLLGEGTLTTDKAVVEGYTYPVSSRIDGTIAGILVSNHQYVKAGDLLAEIDKRDLEAKLAAARTDLVQSNKILPEIETQLSKALAELETAESRMFHRDKELTEATNDYQYISKIRTKKVVSPLLFSRVKKEYESALSEYLSAKMTLVNAGDRVREVQTLSDKNISKMHTAETTVRQTESELSYTKIYAPANGYVLFAKTNFANRLLAGEPFLKLVGDDPWVVANFNENQLKHIKLGQRVTIRIEAIKQHTFQGEVVNIAPVARGSAGGMALLLSLSAFIDPPQIVPVKIAFDSESVLGLAEQIDPGLDAFVEIDAR
jgi:membrane fusion protein, multidrug efflux system